MKSIFFILTFSAFLFILSGCQEDQENTFNQKSGSATLQVNTGITSPTNSGVTQSGVYQSGTGVDTSMYPAEFRDDIQDMIKLMNNN